LEETQAIDSLSPPPSGPPCRCRPSILPEVTQNRKRGNWRAGASGYSTTRALLQSQFGGQLEETQAIGSSRSPPQDPPVDVVRHPHLRLHRVGKREAGKLERRATREARWQRQARWMEGERRCRPSTAPRPHPQDLPDASRRTASGRGKLGSWSVRLQEKQKDKLGELLEKTQTIGNLSPSSFPRTSQSMSSSILP